MRPTAAAAALTLATAACAVTSHPVEGATLGTPRSAAELLAVIDQPGPIEVETVASARWAVDRSGLVNLEHPRAKAAGLADGLEPIAIYFHALRHPERGTFLVDTGAERALRDAPGRAALRGLVARVMHAERIQVVRPLGDWLAEHPGPVQGVLLTHLHLDHVTGMADVPAGTPVFTGPGEAGSRALLHAFVRASTDRALEGKPPLREWGFQPDRTGRFAGVIDVFGDGSLWAIHVPGHTPGSTAYLARTPRGPVLMTGDACHTRWGWENGVEPGTFSADRPRSAVSLAALKALAAEHPSMSIRLGHQE